MTFLLLAGERGKGHSGLNLVPWRSDSYYSVYYYGMENKLKLLVIVVTLLCMASILVSIREIWLAIMIKKTSRPKVASECYFCMCTKNQKERIITSLVCIHPKGKDLSTEKDPRCCPVDCRVAIGKINNLSFEKALASSDWPQIVALEIFRILASITPTIIAVYKLLDSSK